MNNIIKVININRWTVKLFKKGSQDGLTSEDIYTPLNPNDSKTPADDLERRWNCIKENSSKPFFIKAIIQTFWLKYLCIVIFVILEQIILRNSQPFIMNWIIEYFTIEPTINVTRKDAFIYATIIIATIIAISFIAHHVYCVSQILGMKIRVACCALIYKKILKLNKSAFKKNKRDQIINILNNDVYNFDLLPLSLNFLWITFIQMIIIFPIVWQSIGLHVIVGFGALLTVVISKQGCIQIVDSSLRKMIEKLTDQRNQIVNEITIGIKIIKMYVLEKYFDKVMTKIRTDEVQQLRRSLHIRVFHGCLQGITYKIMVFATLISLSSEGVIFNSRIIYNISVYYHILQLLAIIYLPTSMNRIVEIYKMINKIQNFLLLDETCVSSITLNNLKNSEQENGRNKNQLYKSSSGVEIELNEVSASWRINHPLQILNSITLKFKSGELCAVVGPAGSGKSSLLNLLLQELPVNAGTVRLFQMKNGVPVNLRTTLGYVQRKPEITISYASQDPLIFSGTIKDNILFGLEYDQTRYQEVCFLVKDFKELPHRDMTIVEEGGKSLSIDLKTKINLARAIYRQADLYLLDDIFHGIDDNDSQFIFNECVLGFLQGKTRILVTDYLDYLKQADTIAVIEKGSIKYQGTFVTLKEESFEFNELLHTIQQKQTTNYTKIITTNMNEENESIDIKFNLINSRYTDQFTCRQEVVEIQVDGQTEDRTISSTNNLKKTNYSHFNSWREISIYLSLLILIILWQLANISVDQWMTYWTTVQSIRTCIQAPKFMCINLKSQLNSMLDTKINKSFLDEHNLIAHKNAKYIYTVLIITLIGLFISSVYFLINFCISVGQKVYNLIFCNFLKAKMEFFSSQFSEKTGSKLLNDVQIMDNSVIPTAIQTMVIIFQIILTIINIATVCRWIILPFIFMGPILFYLTRYFCKTIQNIQKLENNIKNPLDLYVRETLHGLTTIRSYRENVMLKLCKKFNQHQEMNAGARYTLISIMSAYNLAIELLFCIFISFVYFLLIAKHQENTFNESVGFAISQSLILMSLFQYGIQQIVIVLSQITIMKRIIQFIDTPNEGPIETPNPPPANWPSDGQIIWRNIFVNNRKSDLSDFQNADLMIKPCWKVGVVEKSDADQTSIISALFRLVDKGTHGEIIIDGLDTKSVGLQDLRSNISIIPKNPFLFTGTLRFNLDPFQQYTDKAIWDVLGEVELNGFTLNQWVTDGGRNFSINERKLICLARELLRSNRILVLDQITDGLDLNTKIIIQRVLQSYFKYCTIITITNHLESLISGDLILVMNNGRLLEFGSPYELLIMRIYSHFGQMIKKYNQTMIECIIQDVIKYHAQQRRYNSRKK